MSSNKLRLIHSAEKTPLTSDLERFVREMIDAVDLEPRAFYHPPAADSTPDWKIESLEKKVFEIEDWASKVEKWAIDEVRRAQEELAASTDTIAQCRLRVYELEMLVSDLDEKLQAAASASRQPVAKERAPAAKASRPARVEFDGQQWLSRASRLISAGDFSLEAWTTP
jgi:hypothetical protein